ncbi:hypothetical protein N7481_012756 [Penicillium waksmanii]|uniref:uncharacterized protein n=1 Tax=Penicillium waksmanii TaxID=69791 RepID=UPI002546E557|nr:uncharacterized protein N7481_012756 [Penicillium waksmanii]KAJ5966042.1 hypothetical protein N7481_012756 [Penicillium waksmanii]
MISQVHESEDTELCKKILVIISIIFRPITLYKLTLFIKLPDDDYDDLISLEEIIIICGSFLTLQKYTIVFIYQSVKEFLLKEALSEILPRGIEAKHDIIFIQSLNEYQISRLYTKDICKPSLNPLAAVAYLYIYWIDYLKARLLNRACELGVYD